MSTLEKISRLFAITKKRVLFTFRRPHGDTLPVFMLGSNRTGTSILINIFQRDARVEALDENFSKIAQNYMLVYEKVGSYIDYCKAPILIMNAKLNSFDASGLLERYDRAKIIWMFRDYRDVIVSSLEKSRARVQKHGTRPPPALKNLILFDTGDNWVTRGIQNETVEKLSRFRSIADDFGPYDWMGLVWWSVNHTIVLDRLYQSKLFHLLQYENLVRDPEVVLRRVYDFIGLRYKPGVGKYLHTNSVGAGVDIRLHPSVEELCGSLYEQLKLFSHAP